MARILVVEDENLLRKNIVDRLRAEGHDLYDAPSAGSGAELAAIIDCPMPTARAETGRSRKSAA